MRRPARRPDCAMATPTSGNSLSPADGSAARWDHVTDATSAVGVVAEVARDQMHVHMRYRLPRGRAVIDADVEAVGPALARERDALAAQQRMAGTRLVVGEIEEARAVALGDDERVAA